MPVSMTGFGRCETGGEGFSHVWEIRSVNGRFLDVKWRLPGSLRCMENAWEKVVRRFASRGRVDISLNLEVKSPELLGVTLNETMADAMFVQLSELAQRHGQTFEPDFNRVMGMSNLWREAGGEPDPGLLDSLGRGLENALAEWKASREAEGEDMARDLDSRVSVLREYTAQIAERIPEVLAEKREALRTRIREALDAAGAEFSEDRILQEIAILTDKLDVSEELTRLDSHLVRLAEVLDSDGDAGKKLDFILQETFREINTCGNKAQDTAVSRLVVDFKAELEKCREQVQNIE
ncbi:YicC/YloC family endoribonuclease [Desulfovibrio oxyclinae]|uniref:YicC/YloC family endoribonuclease n=1 Tax=Desulfovibrio oxyclinae TaxID=63560 RepID=UPI000476C700|nr:YicC/YloC family endoribonuclease [Desulfovibrio oxyclinae]